MTRRPRRLITAIAATALGATFGADALADGTTPQEPKAAAQVLFEQGRALVEQGQFADACPKLAESARLDPGIGTWLWLGDCYENEGLTASAWASFKDAAAAAATRRDERERVARQRAAALEPKLSRLNIVVAPEAIAHGVRVQRDGLAIGEPEWGLALPVDPGSHTITATSPGRTRFSSTVRVPPDAAVVSVTVPLPDPLAPASAPMPPAGTPTGVAPPSAMRPVAAPVARAKHDASPAPQGVAERGAGERGAGQRGAGIAVAALGAAAIGVGAVFSFDAKARYDDSNRDGHCLPDNECDATGKSERGEANRMALVATLAMGAGAAAVAAGATLYLLAPRASPVAIAFAPGPRGQTVRLSMAW